MLSIKTAIYEVLFFFSPKLLIIYLYLCNSLKLITGNSDENLRLNSRGTPKPYKLKSQRVPAEFVFFLSKVFENILKNFLMKVLGRIIGFFFRNLEVILDLLS